MKQLNEEMFHECIENLKRRRGADFAKDFLFRVTRADNRTRKKAKPKMTTREKLDFEIVPNFFPVNKSKHYAERNESDEVSKMPAKPSDLTEKEKPTTNTNQNERKTKSSKSIDIHQNTGK
eukprot:5595301-Amphidinium_carterae.1